MTGNVFTKITGDTRSTAVCPHCEQWLWKIGPSTGFYGDAAFESAAPIFTDGDTIQFGPHVPAPLTSYAEIDSQILKGNCPHCGESYWLVVSAFPERPIRNCQVNGGVFMCGESFLDFHSSVEGTFIGTSNSWTVMRQKATWDGEDLRVDIHLIGPFIGTEELAGPFGVAPCNGGHTWDIAAETIHSITPHAVEFLHAS